MNRSLPGRTLVGRLALLAISQLLAADLGVSTHNAAAKDRVPGARGQHQIENELRFNRAVVRHCLGDDTTALDELPDVGASETAIKYYRGILLLKLGKVGEASRLLSEVLNGDEAPPDTAVYLAIASLHAGSPRHAEEVIGKFLTEHPRDDYARYLLSVSLAQQEISGVGRERVPDISQAAYQEAMDVDHPYLSSARASDESVDPTAYRAAAKRNWNVSVLVAYEYDSNVPLAPNFVGLGSNFVDHEDSRTVVATFGELLLFERPNVNLGLVGSTFDTFQFDLEEFNLQDYMGGGFANAAVGNWIVGVRYEFHETLLDENHFADEHRLTPNLSYMGYNWGHTTFYYEYDRLDSNAPALIPEQFQSANIQSTGVTQAIYTFDGQGRIYAGYRFDHANADGSDFDRNTHMVTGRLEVPVSRCSIVDADVRYFWDDYPNPNSLDFFERPRRDGRITVRTGYQQNFGTNWSMRLDYTFINNHSSVENLFGVHFYEYARHVLSTQLIFTF